MVLHGAKAFSLPLKFGQHSYFFESEQYSNTFKWLSFENNQIWFQASFDSITLEPISQEHSESLIFVSRLIKAIKKLKPTIVFTKLEKVEHHLDFNRNWGLGSSSSLIYNMAQWAGINPFELHFEISKGSGYDIAAANSNSAFFYQLNKQIPSIKYIHWQIPFKHDLLFVYSGHKQDSAKSIKLNQNSTFTQEILTEIDQISEQVAICKSLKHFINLLDRHENILSEYLNTKPVKQTNFQDFNGTVKSLGAWGGDFLLAVGAESIDKTIKYFSEKNYTTYFKYSELIYE